MHQRNVADHQKRVAQLFVGALIIGGLMVIIVTVSPMLSGATFHEVTSGQRGFWLAVAIGCLFAGALSTRKL